MKVLVTGAGGQLGLDLVDAYEGHEVVGLTHADLDVADEAAVLGTVTDHEPDLVVNSAAWTAVDACESDPDRAHAVNALGPWWLARACHLVGATLVHISTDYVFDGVGFVGMDGQRRPYDELDPVRPINVYGRSKAFGERLVRETLREHHIVRTAWVCGARGNNFVRTMLRVGREHGAARVVDDQIGSPTFTRDLAIAIRELSVSGRYGTVHRTNAGACSWHDLAAATFELAGLDVELTRMSSDELDRPAPRPSWSVLSARHATTSGLTPMRHWRDGLADLLEELAERGAEEATA
ncbi:MAG: dTDP-4-dehydrorhamnose reductase [Actinomycetes bacterium]